MCNTTLYLPYRRNTMQDRARWLDMVSDAPYEQAKHGWNAKSRVRVIDS